MHLSQNDIELDDSEHRVEHIIIFFSSCRRDNSSSSSNSNKQKQVVIPFREYIYDLHMPHAAQTYSFSMKQFIAENHYILIIQFFEKNIYLFHAQVHSAYD